jgi:outer membrane receptor protein involved in Fe transport
MISLKSHLIGTAGSAILAFALAAPAMAQNPAPAAAAVEDEGGEEEVVVTGTRLKTGLETPTPSTVSNSEQLKAAAPTLVSEALNQLPAFKNSSRPSTGTQSQNRDNSAAFLNLRALGTQRTLVLLDGKRFVPSATSGVPDVSLFPQQLVKRVEIVTGGASAAYGSDAVAGVVNFILDTKFEGTRITGSTGISTYGDGAFESGSLTYGTAFNDDRGHFVASAEVFHQDRIGWNTGRDELEAGWGIGPSGLAAPNPTRAALAPYVFNIPAGGRIASGPLSGMQFLPGGVLAPYNFGTNREGTRQLGGDGLFLPFDLSAGVDRYTGFAHLSYDITENVTVYAQLSGAKSSANYDFQQPQVGITATDYTIYSDNAFLPAAVRTALGVATPTGPAANPVALFTLKRINVDSGYINSDSTSETFRFVGGVDWQLGGDWELNAYYQYGENNFKVRVTNDPMYRRRYAAADAVFSNGQIVCRSTLLGLDPGCVPTNLFGDGSPSQASYDWINGTSERDLIVTESVASLAANGTIFSLPAGDAHMAIGVEYRKETADQTTDAITSAPPNFTGVRGAPGSLNTGVAGGWHFNVAQPLTGEYSVTEGFLELDVPLLKDVSFAKSLSVNGAVRLIDYSTVGQVTTWKVGTSWEPTDGVRFRATRSRDIRAANMEELFTTTVVNSIGGLIYNGQTRSATGLRSGNPNLDPEIADTTTIGVVFKPDFLPGLGLSIDYYDIKIAGAIAQLLPQQTIDQCNAGSAVACANVRIDSSGQLQILLPTLNLNSINTSGVDFEATYNTEFDAGDSLSLRLLVNYVDELSTTVPGGVPVDRAGDIGLTGLPQWSGVFQATYRDGPWTLFAQERYIGGGKIDSTLTTLAGNDLDPVWYSDVTLVYGFEAGGGDAEVFATINNIFNQKPRIAPSVPFGNYRPTNASLYDTIGMFITVGVRLQF